ncbi:MAG: Hsp20 family protein [Legionellales bacterium]|nr:Hsp20 family protein [Legionellales bacterium]
MSERLSHLRSRLPTSFKQHNPLLNIQNTLDEVLHNFYNTFDLPTFPLEEFENLTISPSIDIVNTDKFFKLEAEMPGLSEKDIDISITDGTLTISGEKKTSKQDKHGNYVTREIHYGAYQRNILLPQNVDTTKVKATFKKGMLWVEIPKKTIGTKVGKHIKIERITE